MNVQPAYSHFNINIKTYFYHHFPIQQTKIKYSNRNEWINKALRTKLSKEKAYLFIRRNTLLRKTLMYIKSSETKIFRTKEKLKEIITKNNLN